MKKLLILTTALVLVAAACNKQAAVQPAQNQTANTDKTSNLQTYTNPTYHFSLDLPAQTYDPSCKTSKPVQTQENGNVIKIGASFSCADRDPEMPFQGWTVYASNNISSQQNAQAFLDKMFGKGCKILEWDNKGIYFIDSLNKTNNNPFGDCKFVLTGKVANYYSPALKTMIFWSLGQEFEFYNADGSTNDGKISASFKFTDSASTANWKTYSNSANGFEIKYPNSYTANAKTNQLVSGTSFIQFGQSASLPTSPTPNPATTLTKFSVNGNEAYKSEVDNGIGGQYYAVFIKKASGNYVMISFTASPQITEKTAEFDQILSTFKFTKADNTFIKIDGYNGKHITVLLDGSILGTPSGHLATSQLKALNDTISKTDFNVLDSNNQLTCSSSIGTNVDFKIQVNGQLHSYSVCDSKLTTTEPFKSLEFTLRYFLQ